MKNSIRIIEIDDSLFEYEILVDVIHNLNENVEIEVIFNEILFQHNYLIVVFGQLFQDFPILHQCGIDTFYQQNIVMLFNVMMIIAAIIITIFLINSPQQFLTTKRTNFHLIDHYCQLENTYSIIFAPILRALRRVSSESR